MSEVATVTWFARHELRLARRDFLGMLTAGRRSKWRNVAIGLMAFVVLMHLPAYAVVARFAELAMPLDRHALIVITGVIFLAWTLMLSQAVESVTRILYARADLDLVVSSPIPLTRVFSVRLAAIASTVTTMAALFALPFIDVLAVIGGAHWLAGFGVVVAIGLSASAAAIALTILLFRVCGPARTRFVAQVLAAVAGAGFVIALQIAAILSYGTLSRFAVLTSDAALSFAPRDDSIVWWPARAMLGDANALLGLIAVSLVLLGLTMAIFSPRFGGYVAGVVPRTSSRGAARPHAFRSSSPQAALRRKEFQLLWRDPWLISQTLMQLLYLLPPALLLWHSFDDSPAALVVLAPVIVMAAGQLAGGLAWLTISGEDAPDLVATAPLSATRLVRAKIEVVLVIIGLLFAPIVLTLACAAPALGGVTAAMVMVAAASATAIQLWFRVQARRSQFRRRQTSSRIATFAEAFSSIGWAATAALTLVMPIAAVVTAGLCVAILLATWKISPSRE